MINRDRLIFIVLLILIAITGSQLIKSYLASQSDSETASEFEEEEFAKLEELAQENFDAGSVNIDNQWLPLKPGTKLVYGGSSLEDDKRVSHRIEFTVTDLTKVIDGIRTVVVWIVDYRQEVLVEKEISFFAQDKDGKVWYLGEYPEAYENGELVEAPAWIAGIQEAKAGIAMQADPQAGTPSYSQGWAPAVDWTDRAQVSQTGQEICTALDCYQDVIVLDEFNATEPGFKVKYYAPGVGNIKVGWKGEEKQQEELELVEIIKLDPVALAEARQEALKLEERAYMYAQTLPVQPLTTPKD